MDNLPTLATHGNIKTYYIYSDPQVLEKKGLAHHLNSAKETLKNSKKVHPWEGNLISRARQFLKITHAESTLLSHLATEVMKHSLGDVTPFIWEGGRAELATICCWESVSTVSRTITLLERNGLIQRLHTKKENLEGTTLLRLKVIPSWTIFSQIEQLIHPKKVNDYDRVTKIAHNNNIPSKKISTKTHFNISNIKSSKSNVENKKNFKNEILELAQSNDKRDLSFNESERLRQESDRFAQEQLKTKNSPSQFDRTVQLAAHYIEMSRSDFERFAILQKYFGFHSNYRHHFLKNILPFVDCKDILSLFKQLKRQNKTNHQVKDNQKWLNSALSKVSNWEERRKLKPQQTVFIDDQLQVILDELDQEWKSEKRTKEEVQTVEKQFSPPLENQRFVTLYDGRVVDLGEDMELTDAEFNQKYCQTKKIQKSKSPLQLKNSETVVQSIENEKEMELTKQKNEYEEIKKVMRGETDFSKVDQAHYLKKIMQETQEETLRVVIEHFLQTKGLL